MSDPTTIFENTTVLQRLFAEMPSTFSRDPLSKSMLTFTLLDGSSSIFPQSSSSSFISFSILDSVLSIFSNVSVIESESIDLTLYNFSSLSDYFNYKYYYTGLQCNISAEFAFTDSNLPASMLCEGSYALIGPLTSLSSITLSRFTSNNFALLSAFSLSLLQNRKKMSSSLEQMDLRNAAGKWLDYWGHLLSIDRSTDDIGNDSQYRSRIQYQSLGIRSNNFALYLAVQAATGRNVSVSDGGKPYVLSGSYLSSSGTLLAYPGTTFPYVNYGSSTTYSPSTQTLDTTDIFRDTVLGTATATGSSGSTSITIASSSPVTAFLPGYLIDSKITVAAGSFVVGTRYIILDLGSATSANWNTGAGTSSVTYTIGSSFVAATNGSVATGGSVAYSLIPDGTYIVSNTSSTGGNGTLVLSNALTGALSSTPIFSYSSTWTRTLERLGPVTGSGTFIISLSLNADETSLPQPVLSSLVPLINKWKPVGMPYVIQSL